MRGVRWRERARDDERGVVLVLVAFLIVALAGFMALAVDIGQLAVARRQLQNAVDAGAHAGVQVLPDDIADARIAASDWTLKNKVLAGAPENVTVSITRTNLDNDTITVTAHRTVNHFFARVLNISSEGVTATASATVGSITAAPHIMPFGILDENGSAPGFGYTFGQVVRLKEDEGGSWRSGNRGYLALDGKTGGSNLRQELSQGGSKTVYRIHDFVPTEPGNKTGPGRDGMNNWATSHNDSMYTSSCNDWTSAHAYVDGKLTITPTCAYRTVLIPIIYYSGCSPQPCWPNGRKDVEIIGFAQAYISGWADPDDERDIDAVFLDDSWRHPDAIWGPLDTFGTRVVKLTQ